MQFKGRKQSESERCNAIQWSLGAFISLLVSIKVTIFKSVNAKTD